MFSFFNSLAASTNFQKYRLQLTAKNYDSPNEANLRNILKTFCSEDKETKAQIAFATILKKMLNSDSKNNWIYLLKNLVILDRVVEEGVFAQEISELSISTIDNYKETDKRYDFFDSERILKVFWKLIKEKSYVLASKKHIFCYKRSQRQEFLASLNAMDTLKQIMSTEYFFELTFELVDVLSGKKLMEEKASEVNRIAKVRQEFTKSKLLQYIYLQILQKFMLYYSCQLLANQHFLELLIKTQKQVKTQQIRRFRKYIINFKSHADRFIHFIEKNKHIKGFEEINYKELNPYHREEVLKVIDKLLYEDEKVENQTIDNLNYRGSIILRVEKKPSGGTKPVNLIPRIKPKKEPVSAGLRRKSALSRGVPQPDSSFKKETNPFVSWINSYSHDFPQKEVMTVDLITLLKKESQQLSEQLQVLPDVQRQTNLIYYQMRDTNVTVNYEVNLKSEDDSRKQFDFKNIFSSLSPCWNPT